MSGVGVRIWIRSFRVINPQKHPYIPNKMSSNKKMPIPCQGAHDLEFVIGLILLTHQNIINPHPLTMRKRTQSTEVNMFYMYLIS